MKSSEFNKLSPFGDGSGISSYLDPRIEIFINKYGFYEEKYLGVEEVILNPLISKVASNLIHESSRESAKPYFSNISGIKLNDEIGYYKSLYIGNVIDNHLRMTSSSGGLGTWILMKLMKENHIDYAIHVKKNFDKTSNILFKYQVSENIDQIFDGAKTRYYPVELSEVLTEIKEKPGRYAIVGVPSVIRSIKKLCQVDKAINERIKHCIVLICGHQKSSKFAEYMGWQAGILPGQLSDIDFRHKFKDRPADLYGIKISGKINGESKSLVMKKEDLDGQDWGQGFFKAPYSDFTDDVFGECGDMVIGDAWLPGYVKDSKGTNIIIARSLEMEKLIKKGLSDRELNLKKTDPKTILSSQAGHYQHTYLELPYRAKKAKKIFDYEPQSFIPISPNITLLRKAIQTTRLQISTKSHRAYNQAAKMLNIRYFKNQMVFLKLKYRLLYIIFRLLNKIFQGSKQKKGRVNSTPLKKSKN